MDRQKKNTKPAKTATDSTRKTAFESKPAERKQHEKDAGVDSSGRPR